MAQVVADIDKGFKALIKQLSELGNSNVLIGIQEKTRTPGNTKNGRKQKSGVNVAEYAAQNEFGVREKRIPPRSFMRSSFDENIDLIEDFLAKQTGLVADGKKTASEVLKFTGVILEGMIKAKIRQIVSPQNSDFTIALKGSDKPLIDFGTMINSVRYTIKKRKGINEPTA